jgi:hypothetical protein
MRIQETAVHCLACKHEWRAEMIVEAPVKLCIASIRELSCPTCGAGPKKIAFGRSDVPDPKPVQDGTTDPEKRAAWLDMHDNGLSSECIADVMCGVTPTGNYPLDGDDFGRCERLLILYPEWRARLKNMAAVNPVWAALVEHWDEIVVAWRHDVDLYRGRPRTRSGWRCYPLMRSIIEPIEKSSRSV